MALTAAPIGESIGALPRRVEAYEVDGFTLGVAGVSVDYVRTDEGIGPATSAQVGSSDLLFSTGKLGFSAKAQSEVPSDRALFALMDVAPPGLRWNGVDVNSGDLIVLPPGTTFLGNEPAGVVASVLVVPTDVLGRTAADLRRGAVKLHAPQLPVMKSMAARSLAIEIRTAAADIDHLIGEPAEQRLLEGAVRVLSGGDGTELRGMRRLDSVTIVGDCLEFATSAHVPTPSIAQLCRVAHVSESRLREAFVDVFDLPPSRYFQVRQLSLFREALVAASPRAATVTAVAFSLGITQLGRAAGRYRVTYGELPSATLRRVS